MRFLSNTFGKFLLISMAILSIVGSAFGGTIAPTKRIPTQLDYRLQPMLAIDHPKIDAPGLEASIASYAVQDPAPQPSSWAFAGFYAISSRETSTGATANLGTWTDVLGRGITLYVDAYLGFTTVTNAPVSGFWLSHKGHLAREVTWGAGIGVVTSNGKPIDYGIGVQLNWRWGT